MKMDCTLADVGRAAGVTAATASMALRHNPRISQATQKRVRLAARRLGYRPDPVLSALVARRDRNRKTRAIANLAVLIDDRWPDPKRAKWMRSFLQGMHSACRQLGYHLDELPLKKDPGTLRGLDRLLHARGIRGVALLPAFNDDFQFDIDFERYALVVIGNARIGQITDRVGSDAFAAIQIACEHLARRGYRRLGLAHPHDQEKRLRYQWLAALSKEHFLPGSPFSIVPPYLPDSGMEEREFFRWLRKHKPECILTNSDQMLPWLEKAGVRVPLDLGIVFLSRDTIHHPNPSGMSQHLDFSGQTAIEMLHTSLLRGEIGFPKIAKEILIRPHWFDGGSVRS